MNFSASTDSTPQPLDDALLAAFDRVAGEAPRIGVAMSGGSDSNALLTAAAAWARTRNRKVFAATVDHGLRTEAVLEALAARSLCDRQGVPHDILRWRPPSSHPGQSLARTARHRLLAQWARRQGVRMLAIGHTRDDRIETFLMRLRAGSGWWGLAGPMPSAPSPVWPEGRGLRLVRPLLGLSREALREHLRAMGETWSDDPSNANPAFERVRMRTLAAQLPASARDRVVRIQDRLGALRAATAAEARTIFETARLTSKAARLSAEAIRAAGEDARLRLIEALVLAAAGSDQTVPAEALRRASAGVVARDNGALTLAGGWLRWSGGSLEVLAAPPRRGEPAPPAPAWDRAAALLADPLGSGPSAPNGRTKVTAA